MEILTFSEAAGVIVMHIGVTTTGQDQGGLTQKDWELTALHKIVYIMNSWDFHTEKGVWLEIQNIQ